MKHTFTTAHNLTENLANHSATVSFYSVRLDSDASGRLRCIKELEMKLSRRQHETTVVGHVTPFSTLIRISLMERGSRP